MGARGWWLGLGLLAACTPEAAPEPPLDLAWAAREDLSRIARPWPSWAQDWSAVTSGLPGFVDAQAAVCDSDAPRQAWLAAISAADEDGRARLLTVGDDCASPAYCARMWELAQGVEASRRGELFHAMERCALPEALDVALDELGPKSCATVGLAYSVLREGRAVPQPGALAEAARALLAADQGWPTNALLIALPSEDPGVQAALRGACAEGTLTGLYCTRAVHGAGAELAQRVEAGSLGSALWGRTFSPQEPALRGALDRCEALGPKDRLATTCAWALALVDRPRASRFAAQMDSQADWVLTLAKTPSVMGLRGRVWGLGFEPGPQRPDARWLPGDAFDVLLAGQHAYRLDGGDSLSRMVARVLRRAGVSPAVRYVESEDEETGWLLVHVGAERWDAEVSGDLAELGEHSALGLVNRVLVDQVASMRVALTASGDGWLIGEPRQLRALHEQHLVHLAQPLPPVQDTGEQ